MNSDAPAADRAKPSAPSLGINPAVSLYQLVLLLRPQTWLHRRVESVVLLDEATARRSVSIDFSLPTPAPADTDLGVLVPIAYLQKHGLVNFDLCDETGRSVPLLTRAQNGRVSAAALLRLAYFERPELIDSIVDKFVPRLVQADDTQGQERQWAWDLIFDRRTSVGRHLAGRAEFVGLARDLSRYFVAYAVLSERPNERRILKFQYDAPLAPRRRGARAFLGWRPMTFSTDELPVGHSASYHLEIEAPEETEFTYAVLVSAAGGSFWVSDSPVPTRRAHMNVEPQNRGTVGEAWFGIRARRPGMLRSAAVSAAFSALVLSIIRLKLGSFEEASVGKAGTGHAGSDAVAALLATFPAVLATYVVRPGEHAVVGRVLFGVRLLLLASGAIAFFAALSLFAGLSASSLSLCWTIAVVLEYLLLLALVNSVRLPRPVRRR